MFIGVRCFTSDAASMRGLAYIAIARATIQSIEIFGRVVLVAVFESAAELGKVVRINHFHSVPFTKHNG